MVPDGDFGPLEVGPGLVVHCRRCLNDPVLGDACPHRMLAVWIQILWMLRAKAAPLIVFYNTNNNSNEPIIFHRVKITALE